MRRRPCPYSCCMHGVLSMCLNPVGFECMHLAPVQCGGNRCVQASEECPDTGELDAGDAATDAADAD